MSVGDEDTSFLSKNVIRKHCPKNSFKYVPTFGAPTRSLIRDFIITNGRSVYTE